MYDVVSWRTGSVRRALLVAALMSGALAAAGGEARAYTPSSPEVQQMIQKALAYLSGKTDEDLGGKCLIGLAFLKNDYDESQPEIAAAVQACKEFCKGSQAQLDGTGTIYSPAIAAIFLCELNPQKYRTEIDKLMALLLRVQQKGGGWGYDLEPHQGDTSQTQYGVLFFWTAQHAGVNVPLAAIENVGLWLMRTQDASGGWVYKPNDPGGSNRVAQGEPTHSITVAGLGSVFVVAELLGLSAKQEKETDDGLPPALKVVEEKKDNGGRPGGPRSARVDASALRRAQTDGSRWLAQHYLINPPEWSAYYMYGLERALSFRDLVEGTTTKEPSWYNDGVVFLQKTQKPWGGWEEPSLSGRDPITTSFYVLFLTRSTQKAIQKALGEGVLRGGRGLPTDTTKVRVQGGRVVSSPVSRSLDDLLQLLDDPDSGELQNLAMLPDQLVIRDEGPIREVTADRLRRLVSAESFEARIVAVRALAQARDLNNVPVLIYALGDPDVRVVNEARDALRFVSRRIQGFGPPNQSTPEQRQAAQAAWKQWYLSVRPDAQFLD